MADSRYGSLQVCLLRVAMLEASGAPAVGADNGYVSEGTISVDIGIELSDDVDLEQINGCGNVCQAYFKQGAIKRATADLVLCELDIQIAQLVIGGALKAAAGTPLGWEYPKINDAPQNGVCLEAWARAWDGSEQAVPAALGGTDPAWWHFVWPKYKGQLDDHTLENEFMEFSITGFSTENALMPLAGPFGDWPSYISSDGGITASGAVFLDTNYPDSVTGYVEVTDGAS